MSHCAAMDRMTSLESSVLPSWKVTPSRRVQVQTVRSSLAVHSVASDGWVAVPPISYAYSDSLTCSQTRSDSPSVSSAQ